MCIVARALLASPHKARMWKFFYVWRSMCLTGVALQVPLQRLLGLHCARLVPQPPQVPVCHPLQRLGLGRLP